MKQLDGRTAVVTGAASGIGLSIAESLASRGITVVMTDVEKDVLEKEADRLSRANFKVAPIVTDVTSFDSVKSLADEVDKRFGPLHILVNNAGVSGNFQGGPIWAEPQCEWDWVVGVNLYGIVNGLRAFIPGMIAHGEEGHIVNTSSVLGLIGGAGSIYHVSKHAATRLTEILYFDLKAAAANIGVTLLCPGTVATNISLSGRNRPIAPDEAEGSSPDETQRAQALHARINEEGISPHEVGEKVIQAILDNQFYLVTHLERLAESEPRLVDIQNSRPPSPIKP